MESTIGAEQVLQLVSFTLEKEEYAVNILDVQEINRITEITSMPNSEEDVKGVINLRGKVIPVINLRKKFGLYEKDFDNDSRIIIIEKYGITNGLIVDSVSEVLRISTDLVEPPPQLSSGVNEKFIDGIAKLDDRLIIMVNVDSIIGADAEV